MAGEGRAFSPNAHVVLLEGTDELGCLAAVLLDSAHHSGRLGVQEEAGLRTPHLEGDVGHLKVGWELRLIRLCRSRKKHQSHCHQQSAFIAHITQSLHSGKATLLGLVTHNAQP